ncbi:MAG: FAD-dependent oxidoreductase [Lachnospiraceae bacterium]|nr:FAD-dependent oxidoreductase [Lachnospiraceae bacterium]
MYYYRINQCRLPVGHSEEDLIHEIRRLVGLKSETKLPCKPESYEISSGLTFEIIRRSLDARKKDELYYSYVIDLVSEKPLRLSKNSKLEKMEGKQEYSFRPSPDAARRFRHRPVVVGMGPAGLFCAYMLAKAGCAPIVIERGDAVEQRREKVNLFWKEAKLDPESNVQFGEGGAGTFSDGKLNTLVKDRTFRAREVLKTFVQFGAPADILYESKPHIGTDLLTDIVKNMREEMIRLGGTVYFRTKLKDIVTAADGSLKAVVLEQAATGHRKYSPGSVAKAPGERTENRGAEDKKTEDKRTDVCPEKSSLSCSDLAADQNSEKKTIYLACDALVLATGHSARDTFAMLEKQGVQMEAKPFAVGVRVQHPQRMISVCQYGERGADLLPPANYKLTGKTSDGRGVYTFCMCPGGYVVNASSEPGHLAVNGMSYHGRASESANSALIVQVTPEDFINCASNIDVQNMSVIRQSDDLIRSGHNLSLSAQDFEKHDFEANEKKNYAYTGNEGEIPSEVIREEFRQNPLVGVYFQRQLESTMYRLADGRIPVQLYGDFKAHRESVAFGDVMPCFRGDTQFARLDEALLPFLSRGITEGMEQFAEKISGFNRDDAILAGIESRTSSPVRILRGDNLQSVSLPGLYPCGEGAGYAGGIMSAAMDGIRVYEAMTG